jgi:choline dehydrogenase-like flavoprotein
VIQLSTPPSWVSDGRALPESLSVEVVIVGSGAGGAVAARHLADRGKEVLVVEEGPWAGRPDFGRPAHEILRTLYRDGGATPVFGFPGTPPIVLAEGRCVGGSTVVNGGTSWRTPPEALLKWQRLGLDELTEAELSPFFDEVERELDVGPVTPDIAGRHNLIVAEGAARLGWSAGWVRRNAAGCAGSGRCPFGCPRDAKRAMHLTYLPRAAHKGARVAARLSAERLLVEGGRAVGLACRDEDGRRVTIRAHQVVLAAGAIHTSNLLRPHRRDAGKSFIIHPIVKAVGLFDERVEGWKGVVQGYYIDEFAGDGILIMTGMVPPELLAFSLGPADHYDTMSRYAHALVVGAIVSDTSRGRVVGGRVTTYRQNRDDRSRTLRAIRRLAELLFASGARRVLLPLVHPHAIDSPSEIADLDGPVSELLTIHPMGTCAMGAVTDARGAVHGLRGLHVADASLMPTSIGVNPQLTIMALAARVAEHL